MQQGNEQEEKPGKSWRQPWGEQGQRGTIPGEPKAERLRREAGAAKETRNLVREEVGGLFRETRQVLRKQKGSGWKGETGWKEHQVPGEQRWEEGGMEKSPVMARGQLLHAQAPGGRERWCWGITHSFLLTRREPRHRQLHGNSPPCCATWHGWHRAVWGSFQDIYSNCSHLM